MGYDKHQAKHEFTRWSESYDQSILQRLLFGPSHRAIIARIKERWGETPIRVLDVGCGTGIFAERILEALPHAQVVGIDLVEGMLFKGLERWKQHEQGVFAVQADSERLPFDRATFDVVTCANSFHHYPNQKRAVAEMKRVLRPNGRLMLIDGYRDRPWVGSFMTFALRSSKALSTMPRRPRSAGSSPRSAWRRSVRPSIKARPPSCLPKRPPPSRTKSSPHPPEKPRRRRLIKSLNSIHWTEAPSTWFLRRTGLTPEYPPSGAFEQLPRESFSNRHQNRSEPHPTDAKPR